MEKYQLPFREVGSYTILLYSSYDDVIARIPSDNNLVKTINLAIELMNQNPLATDCAVDRRVYQHTHSNWIKLS